MGILSLGRSSAPTTDRRRHRSAAPERAIADDHLVGFFDSDDALVETVAPYLADTLRSGTSVIVLATPRRGRQIRNALADRGLDVRGAEFVFLDAADALAAFMVDGMPDPDRFRDVVGGLIERAPTLGRPVRCFGDMVSVLWEQGNLPAVLALEDLWNDLATTHTFERFCGYSADLFGSDEHAATFEAVCQRHARAVPGETYARLAESARSAEPETVQPPEAVEDDATPDTTDVDQLIVERVQAGDLLTRDRHDQVVSDWAARLQRTEEMLNRVVAANEGLMQRLRRSQTRVRKLREDNRDLRAALTGNGANGDG